MSTWSTIVNKAFAGNKGILHGNPNCLKGDGSPDGAVSAKKGTLYWDYTNSDAYINTDGSTAWTAINS